VRVVTPLSAPIVEVAHDIPLVPPATLSRLLFEDFDRAIANIDHRRWSLNQLAGKLH
jgi:hypothetical protein